MRSPLRVAVSSLLWAGVSLPAQTTRTVELGPPTASLVEPFSRVDGVREQSNGQILVLDGIEARIVRVDFRAGGVTPIGRPGRGPGEYTLPVALLALAGDTTLAVDMSGGGRALVITSDGAAASGLRAARVPVGAPLFLRPDVQADGRGRLYELVPRVRSEGGRRILSTFSGVRRLDREFGTQDTIGELSQLVRSPLLRPRATAATEAPVFARATTPPPFASFDQWAVASDGRIAFVTVEPYRVAFVSASGDRVEGPVLSYVPVPMSAALKEQWRQMRQQPVSTLTYGPSGVSAGRTRPRFSEPDAWPDELPPFLPKALRFAPDGVLWIERAGAAGQPQTFDLIDPVGRLSLRVVLPPRTRVVGFGAAAVYTVRIDEDDLEYLERRAIPR